MSHIARASVMVSDKLVTFVRNYTDTVLLRILKIQYYLCVLVLRFYFFNVLVMVVCRVGAP